MIRELLSDVRTRLSRAFRVAAWPASAPALRCILVRSGAPSAAMPAESMRGVTLALLLFAVGSLLALPARSGEVGFEATNPDGSYVASIVLQDDDCCLILSDNVVDAAPVVSAYMHASSPDLSAFTGFTMTADLRGQVKMDGRSIGLTPNSNVPFTGLPGILLKDTLTPNGPDTNGNYAIVPYLEITGQIIRDTPIDLSTALMQIMYSVVPVGTTTPCGGTGQVVTLPVDTASSFDLTLGGTSACNIPKGGSYTYSVSLGEVIGGATQGQIANAFVHLADIATVSFGLPDGVTLDSASGAFQNVPVPEPSTLAEVALGATLLAAARSRRRHAPSED